MRIVYFKPDDIAHIVYPAEGVPAFGPTKVHGDLIVGEYNGHATEEELPNWEGPWPLTETRYRVNLKPGEIMKLLGAGPFAKINTAAYPVDGSPVDENALFFMESAKYPYSDDGLITVNTAPVTEAMTYFVYKEYMTQEDADRVIRGIPYEVEI